MTKIKRKKTKMETQTKQQNFDTAVKEASKEQGLDIPDLKEIAAKHNVVFGDLYKAVIGEDYEEEEKE